MSYPILLEHHFLQHPLIAAQPGIWMAEQLAGDEKSFTVAHYLSFKGELVRDLFEQAIREGLSHADSIHARFGENEQGEPIQYLPKKITPELINAPEWFDFSQQEKGVDKALTLMQQDITSPCLAKGNRPLYRQIIIQVKPQYWFWYQRFHHLTLDGFSFNVLTAHIIAIYEALRQAKPLPTNPFTPFSEVINEYLQWDKSPVYQQYQTFWLQHCADFPDPVSLTETENKLAISVTPQRYEGVLENIDFTSLLENGRFTQDECLMTGLCIWFYRMTKAPNFTVGFPFMRRMGSAALTALGAVVNILPLQLRFTQQTKIHDAIEIFVKELKVVRRYQRYEAEQLRRDLGFVGSKQSLYNLLINNKIYQSSLSINGQTVTTNILSMGFIDGIEIEINHSEKGLSFTLYAPTESYSQQTLAFYADSICRVLQQVTTHPEYALGQISLLDFTEQKKIDQWSQGADIENLSTDVTLLDKLAYCVNKIPNHIALTEGDLHLTYREFYQQISQLAHYLIAQGIVAEDVIALALPRSAQTVITIFAILTSGATYLPLDKDYPIERLALICDDAQPKLIITHTSLSDRLPKNIARLALDDPQFKTVCHGYCVEPVDNSDRPIPLKSAHLAYIIYTSGSTGQPKGVMIPHKGLLNLLFSHDTHLFGPAIRTFMPLLGRQLRVAHTASFTFDSSWEPLLCLLMGAELVIFNEELRRDSWALLQQMQLSPIDIMDITPSFLTQMIESGLFAPENKVPQLIMIGGEAITPRLWKKLYAQSHIQFYNYYGPSEYTVDTVGALIAQPLEPIIGRPIANTQVWLLDDCLQQAPIGMTGELYIAGAGLARGYLGKKSLTATHFVANPFRKGELMYRTGDMMRWTPQGQLQFIGRHDQQIKISGFRIELGEIENVLASLPEVKNAAVIAKPLGVTWQLIAFCTVSGFQQQKQADIANLLQQALAEKLPDYMLPTAVIVLDTLPMMSNGKIDRQALPALVNTQLPQQTLRLARSEAEKRVCEAISHVLAIESVAIDADFFSLGGDSISAMALANQLRRTGWVLTPKQVFNSRTPEIMAQLITPIKTENPHQAISHFGNIDSLPILHWYREQGQHTFAHGLFLKTPNDLTAEKLIQLMQWIVQFHPALGAKLVDGELVVGRYDPQLALAQCHTLWVTDEGDKSADIAFEQAIKQLEPDKGLLWQAILLRQHQQTIGLVLVIHHLVIDGVSWRILLDTLPMAAKYHNQLHLANNESTSYYAWSQWHKSQYAHATKRLPFWQSMLQPPCVFPFSHRRKHDSYHTKRTLRTILSPEQTTALLIEMPASYRTRTEVLLLAALLIASKNYWQQAGLRVLVESHGRPDCPNGVDLSQTVGWLTAEYPVYFLLENSHEHLVLAAVTAVKSVLDAIPDKGISYGILRYLDSEQPLTALAKAHAPEVLFNYLGSLETDKSGDWAICTNQRYFCDGLAVYTDSQIPLSYPLEINILVHSAEIPQCVISWGYAAAFFSQQQIEQLSHAFCVAIEQLCVFARDQPLLAADTLTASETGLLLEKSEMQRLRQRYGVLGEVLPLLPLQQGMLFHCRMTTDSTSYNSFTQLTLKGELDQATLQLALNKVVTRYPQLAAWFDSDLTAQPLQILPLKGDARLHWPLAYRQLTQHDDVSAILAVIKQKELATPLFNTDGPMLKALWVQHPEPDCHSLFLIAHHLVVDGWSTPVIIHDLMAWLNQPNLTLPAPAASYGDLIRQSIARDKDAAYQRWQRHLKGVNPTLLFSAQSHLGAAATLTHQFSKESEQALMAFCRQYGLTLNTVMQGIFAVLLSIYAGNDDVIFGSPVSGRIVNGDLLDKQVGLFSNTLPVRVHLDMTQPLLPQLQALQIQQIELIEHDNLNLAEIQQIAECAILFDTLLVVENYPDLPLSLPTEKVHCIEVVNQGYTHYPLTFIVLPGEELSLLLEYRSEIIAPKALLNRFLLLLEQLLQTPMRPLIQWQWLTTQELLTIEQINQTEHHLNPETLYDCISAQRERTPTAIALQDETYQLSWLTMHQQVCALALKLQQQGVKVGDVVAVALPRSVRLSLALQAISVLGAIWLPLDTGYPDERLGLMINDAKPRLLITEVGQSSRFKQYISCLYFDTLITEMASFSLPKIAAQQTAYLLYTSGSTGRPKGVMVAHDALINRLRWMQDQYPIDSSDVVLQKTPCSFDVAIWELFWPLMVGAKSVMAPPDAHRDPLVLTQLIQCYQITTLHFVPSMLASWLDTLMLSTHSSLMPSLKQIFCSGEALSTALALRCEQQLNVPLHNLYGPTEAAIDVTYHPAYGATLTKNKAAGIPIGKPIWNTRLYILDKWLRQLPSKAPGELWLSGVQLAQAYYQRPALTASYFVADPYRVGERMYRTGDIACWREEGSVDYLGRTDFQLKIRGQRVELGEIEYQLLKLPEISQAAVAAYTLNAHYDMADNRQLIAWLKTYNNQPCDINAVNLAMSANLPAYMVPTHYIQMQDFPVNVNGKLNRAALPLPQIATQQGKALHTENEHRMAQLFCRLLGVKNVFADDDFFRLGGHSLLAMRLVVEIQRTFHTPLTINQVISARTVSQLALLVEQKAKITDAESVLWLRKGKGSALFCFHPASGFAWQYSGLIPYLTGDYPIIGLQSPNQAGIIAQAHDLEEVCQHYLTIIQQYQPKGPYYLLGYSLGGVIAHNIAAKLFAQGEYVAFLGLLDSYPPEGQNWSELVEEEAQAEAIREQAILMADDADNHDLQLWQEKQGLLNQIIQNYQYSVMLLSQAITPYYPANATLFSAQHSLPLQVDPIKNWQPFIANLAVYPQACDHATILSPTSLATLGVQLNQIIMSLRQV